MRATVCQVWEARNIMNNYQTTTLLARRMTTWVAALALAWSCQAASGQLWYDYAPPPTSFDWQLFAPVSNLDAQDAESGREGYFGSVERTKMWLMRSNRVPVGNPTPRDATGANAAPFGLLLSNINFSFSPTTDLQGNDVAPGQSSLLLPSSQGASIGRLYNSITDSYARHSEGMGNRLEFGWVEDNRGWMFSIQGGDIHRTDLYGFDDKRIDQVGGTQGTAGLPGYVGLVDRYGNQVIAPVAPTAPTAGFQAIPSIDGLNSVAVVFDDPYELLLGFAGVVDPGADGEFGTDDDFTAPQDINGVDGIQFGNFNTVGGDQLPIAVVYDDLRLENRLDIDSFELMTIRRKKRLHGGATAEMYLGARYLTFDDFFDFYGRGGIAADTTIENNALNRIIGPQFGLRIAKRSRRWNTEIQARFMAGANFLSVRQKGVIGDHLSPGVGTFLGLGGALPTFSGSEFFHRLSNERFTPTGEFRVKMGYQFTKSVALNATWSGMVAGGIARAANTVQYVYPTMGIANRSEDMFAHGVSIGLEMNR